MSFEPKTSQLPTRCLEDMLPLELSDIVFDILTDLDSHAMKPKQSLFACSLVCRSWRERTLRHRFRSLSLYVSLRDDDDQEDDGQDLPEHLVFVIETFMKLEVFALARDAVRSLTLHYGTLPAAVNIDRSFLPFVIHFTCLQSIQLVNAPYPRCRNPATSPVFASIKRLTISGISQRPAFSLHKLSALYDIIGAFSEIEELHLDGSIHLDEESEDSDLDGLAFPRVMSLVLDSAPSVKQLAPLLRRLTVAQPLTKIDAIGYLNDSLCCDALELVKSLPVLPEHLLFSVPLDSPLDLRSLSSLRRITMAVELYVMPQLNDPHGQFVRLGRTNCQLWTRVTEALASLDRADNLEYIEMLLMPVQGTLDPTLTATFDWLETVAAAIEVCEEMLIGMVRKKQLGHIRVALCRARTPAMLLCREPSESSEESVKQIFPRLDELGALVS